MDILVGLILPAPKLTPVNALSLTLQLLLIPPIPVLSSFRDGDERIVAFADSLK